MALSDKEREQIIEEERVRWETRRLLLEQAAGRGHACGPRRHRGRGLFLGALLLGAVALVATACGHRHHGWGAKDPAERASKLTQLLTKKLDLSEDQRSKAQPLVQALVMERESWRGEGPKGLGELKAQFQAASFDAKALEKAAQAREAKLAQSRALAVQKLAEFHAILTPEQRAKAAEHLGKLQERWEKRAKR